MLKRVIRVIMLKSDIMFPSHHYASGMERGEVYTTCAHVLLKTFHMSLMDPAENSDGKDYWRLSNIYVSSKTKLRPDE